MEKQKYEELKAEIEEIAIKINIVELFDYIKKNNSTLLHLINVENIREDIENYDTRLSLSLARNLLGILLVMAKKNNFKHVSNDMDLVLGDF